MRFIDQFVVSLVFTATFVFSAGAFAAEPHSWCITGAPMVVNGSTDATTNAVISNVCGRPGFATCCAGRWSLACVQAAASFAKQNNLSGGDFCGRYAWKQGPIPGTQQYYPRDFNLFAAAGAVSGIRDTDGPVAAAGTTNMISFHLNVKGNDPVALVGQGGIVLYSGTVVGSVQYGSNYNDNGQVTFFGASRPQAKTTPLPINFSDTTTKLIAMSQALQRYEAIAASKANTTITFTGTDPELNVFSVSSTQLTGTTAYSFNVPAGSNVIVNVSGANPALSNAGFSSVSQLTKLLWNFPDATTLLIQNAGVPGSILAPKATGNFQNGAISGTVVVAAAQPADVELYMQPYEVPSCTGGLCLDPTWSVSADTVIDDNGTAAFVKPEAGFIEIASTSYIGEGQARTSPKHRVWYSFQPATSAPKSKPLAVFFNGGPGSATMTLLFAFNTGPMTLDPQITGTQKITTNYFASNWAQFANLLYIDGPGTGFSYPLANDDGTKPDIGTDMDRDPAIFVSTVLRFLKRHPALQNNRVVIVGESYGGVRTTLMLQHIYDYSSLTAANASYQDSQLDGDLRSYFSAVFSTTNPTPVQLATKFGHQVLIEPVVVGAEQNSRPTDGTSAAFPSANCLSPTCMKTSPQQPATCDSYNCDKPVGWSDNLEKMAATNLTDIATLNSALGVDAKTIEWMKASSRTKAYGRAVGDIAQPINLSSVFGTLGPEDNYLVSLNDAVGLSYNGASRWSSPGSGLRLGTDFAKRLHDNVTTFVTASKFDTVVYSPDIPYALELLRVREPSFAALVSVLSYDKNASTGLPRPGNMGIAYFPSTDFRLVTMPHWYVSGHSVSMRAPRELLADVVQWYQASPH